MSLTMSKTGQWSLAEKTLNRLAVTLFPEFQAYIDSAGELFLERVVGHIDAQDLSWTPLSQKTIEAKGGKSTILVETGFLRNNLKAMKVSSSSNTYDIFVGALNNVQHPSGMSLSDLMIWIEYGTDKMPPRPLVRPSWEEVKGVITKEAVDLLKSLVMRRG